MKKIEIPVPNLSGLHPLIGVAIPITLAFVLGLWQGGYWEKSATGVRLKATAIDHLAGSLEHYHQQRLQDVSAFDAVEAFILNASPVLKQPDVTDYVAPTIQPEPDKKDPPPQPPRRIFRRR